MNNYEKTHKANMARYERMILSIYERAVEEAAQIGVQISELTDEQFNFDKFPKTKRRIDALMAKMRKDMADVIGYGIDKEWALADNKNYALTIAVTHDKVDKRQYMSRSDDARAAFHARKVNGLNLSDRIWKYTDMFKQEIEMGLDAGIREGKSAARMASDLKKYLQHPDKLFRRVRDEHGNLQLSKNAKAYHPGQGVYRSSYMNAKRLTATETNIAYRTADYNRLQEEDFVVGIEVHLSNNHNCKGIPKGEFEDICDELQGRYPKDFKFSGWHPFCRCFTTTILMTREEIEENRKRRRKGLPPLRSANEVKDVPAGFRNWVSRNSDRIASAAARGKLPYFLRDNGTMEDGQWVAKLQTQVTAAKLNNPSQTKLTDIIEGAKASGVAYNPVSRLSAPMSEENIITKLVGDDKTKGSCSSLAIAYVGCKAGYDVEDFRGGKSQQFFANNGNIMDITDKLAGIREKQYDDYKAARNLLSQMEAGNEYYFVCGRHAAIVRIADKGYEYLELQSDKYSGWNRLDNGSLRKRFNAKHSYSVYRQKYMVSSCIINIKNFANDGKLKELLGYINTAAEQQVKGEGGGMK